MVCLDRDLKHRYLRFANVEAQNYSPTYEAWSKHVASSLTFHAFLDGLTINKQQPNLLFAAIRLVSGRIPQTHELDQVLQDQGRKIKAVMLEKSTQTNESARCAVLLPLLARLPQPLALIEVGASAGLCLFPELYSYVYEGTNCTLGNPEAATLKPVMYCNVEGNVPLPSRLPDVVWRAGLELNPLNLQDREVVTWLETLVWPEHTERLQRLQKAIGVVKAQSVQLTKGDLLKDLPALLASVPEGTTPVVFHSAVLNYVPDQTLRDEFAKMMLASKAIWISNEGRDYAT